MKWKNLFFSFSKELIPQEQYPLLPAIHHLEDLPIPNRHRN